MKLNPKKTAFGRHETFFCRIGWLTKGFWKANEYKESHDDDFFRQDEAVVKLGAGKNMVSSIKYWLLASQLFKNDQNKIDSTPLGKLLIGKEDKEGWDSFIEDKNTLWLLHWLLASNSELATSYYWFFNLYHKSSFSNEELRTALLDYVKDNVDTKVSVNTLKSDVNVLIRTYAKAKADKKMSVEETLESPFVELNLIQVKPNKSYSSNNQNKNIAPHIIGYVLSNIFEKRGVSSLPVEQLIYSREGEVAIGSIFRLPESNALAHIEKAIELIPGNFEIRDTAGDHQVYKLRDADGMEYLKAYYEGEK